MSFSEYKSFSLLKKLAENPPDLTDKDTLDSKRVKKYVLQAGDFKLLYSLERVDDKILSALKELAKESRAVEKMHLQQAGEIVNPFEKRAALHTALRDVFQNFKKEENAEKAAELASSELKKLQKFLKQNEGKYEYLVHIGIGGSHLGMETVYDALKIYSNAKIKPFFINNLDSDQVFQVLKEVNLEKTLAVVVSKSGTTLETAVNEDLFRKAFKKAGLEAGKHIIAVTTPQSSMDDPGKYKAVFYFWDYIGGRYSVTSMAAGVSLSLLLGFDRFRQMLEGAHLMDLIALKEIEQNLPLQLALLAIWKRNFLNLETLCVIPYCSALKNFCFYLQQLEMESNGKSVNRQNKKISFKTAPFLFGDSGSNAQHSFFQLLHQGTDISAQEFIGFKEPQIKDDYKIKGTSVWQKLFCNMLGSALALAMGKKDHDLNKNFSGNRPTCILLADKLTPYTLGQLIALYEHKTAFQGYVWGINSFDQEGVQLGKNVSKQFLKTLTGEKNPLNRAFLDLI